jgi:hypothetical protein
MLPASRCRTARKTSMRRVSASACSGRAPPAARQALNSRSAIRRRTCVNTTECMKVELGVPLVVVLNVLIVVAGREAPARSWESSSASFDSSRDNERALRRQPEMTSSRDEPDARRSSRGPSRSSRGAAAKTQRRHQPGVSQRVDEPQPGIEKPRQRVDLGRLAGRAGLQRVPLAAVARAVAIDDAFIGRLEQRLVLGGGLFVERAGFLGVAFRRRFFRAGLRGPALAPPPASAPTNRNRRWPRGNRTAAGRPASSRPPACRFPAPPRRPASTGSRARGTSSLPTPVRRSRRCSAIGSRGPWRRRGRGGATARRRPEAYALTDSKCSTCVRQNEMSPDASPASRHARSVAATRTADCQLSRPKTFGKSSTVEAAELVPPLRAPLERGRQARSPSRGRRRRPLRPTPASRRRTDFSTISIRVADPLVRNDVFARREQGKHPLEAQDIPRIGQRAAGDSAVEVVLDLGQQPPDLGDLAALEPALGRHEPPFDLGLEAGRRGRHERALLAGRLRVAELRVQPRNVPILHLPGAVTRQRDVQMLPDMAERLLRQLRLLPQSGSAGRPSRCDISRS